MRKQALRVVLALLLALASCVPATAIWEGPPDTGVKGEGGSSTTIGVFSSKGGIVLDPDDEGGADKYAVIIVRDADTGQPIEAASAQITAVNAAGDAFMDRDMTNAAGQAVVAAYWGKSYYFYGYKAGYYQTSPVVDPIPELTPVMEGYDPVSAGTPDSPQALAAEDDENSEQTAVVEILLKRYMESSELPEEAFQEPITVTVVKTQGDTAADARVSGALVKVTFTTALGGEVSLCFISDENGQFELTLPADVTRWEWSVKKMADASLKDNSGVTQVSAERSAEIYFNAKAIIPESPGGPFEQDKDNDKDKDEGRGPDRGHGIVIIIRPGGDVSVIDPAAPDKEDGGEGTVTLPEGGSVIYPINSENGGIKVVVPPGTEVKKPDGSIMLPEDNQNSKIILPGKDGVLGTEDDVEVTPALDENGQNRCEIGEDGRVLLPDGGDVLYPDGTTVFAPAGSVVLPDGTIIYPRISFADCNRHAKIWLMLPALLYLTGRFLVLRKEEDGLA